MRRIKWGVMGTAYIFERDTAEGMRQAENCQLWAIAGRNREKTEHFREKYGFQKAYFSYEELLADPEVEAVYIPLPNTLHVEWTIKALKAKKHVLCEKPLAPTAADAERMFEAARENGVWLMEAFAYQHSPFIAAVKARLDSGDIGAVRYIETALITSDYDLSNIRMRRETLGGSAYDLGVYCISFIQRMLDMEPERVKAMASFSGEGIDLYTAALLEYPGGVRANLDCGMVLATERNSALDRFQIHGTLGSIESVRFAYNAPGQLQYRIRTFAGLDETVTVDTPHNYALEVEQLGRCIAEGETPAVTGEFSLANARTLDRILAAISYPAP